MRAFFATLVASLLPLATTAHHSVRAFYDDVNVSEIEGRIANIRWRNPHVLFRIERLGENGETEIWEVESGPVNFVERDGVTRDDLTEGEQVRVVGYASRFKPDQMVASYVTLPSGENIVLWPGLFGGTTQSSLPTRERTLPATALSAGAEPQGIFRIWSVGAASSGRIGNEKALPLTPEALTARAGYDPLTDDTALKCIPQGMPAIMDNPFPMEIVDNGDTILIRMEQWDVERTIHMNAAASAGVGPATPHGYSVGRWDGETLVIETANIDWPYFDDIGTPMSDAMDVLERYSLDEDERLHMTMTVTDPATFTEPVHLEDAYWDWVPGEVIKPFNCVL